jgi:CheY-like chemotaxis protein
MLRIGFPYNFALQLRYDASMTAAELWSAPANDADLDAPSVLIVDDDLDILTGLGELLEYEGYQVTTVTDGRAALSHLRRGLRPCLILLDLMMPGMNGWDFRAEQMQEVDLRDIPVVVITAANVTEAALKAQLGDVSLLRKPPMHDELVSIVRRHCGEPFH